MNCFFVSDLHGHTDRYEKLFGLIEAERPGAVFLGGDILPTGKASMKLQGHLDFISDYLVPGFDDIKKKLGENYPRVFLILGNDDGKIVEPEVFEGVRLGIWEYLHNRKTELSNNVIYGYSYVPPTPFRLKDWERYDVSRYVDPGCISPEEGIYSVPVPPLEVKYATIKSDLEMLTGREALGNAVFLFHSPPYMTGLDQAALDGVIIDNVQVDTHVGSIAIKKMIENSQPLLTLHGHVHESARITGKWKETIGKTICINAAHDGKELALVRFDLDKPRDAVRELI